MFLSGVNPINSTCKFERGLKWGVTYLRIGCIDSERDNPQQSDDLDLRVGGISAAELGLQVREIPSNGVGFMVASEWGCDSSTEL